MTPDPCDARAVPSGFTPFGPDAADVYDGRTQGTVGMFDSLPYRNDAAIVLRRLARSLPLRAGVVGIATCDKGLPAMTMAVAGLTDLPGIIVPGGVTLPPKQGEDAGAIQTIGTRYAHGLITLEEAADLGCRACASPGGGCQFLGTAATAQVVAEALAGGSLGKLIEGDEIAITIDTRDATGSVELAAHGERRFTPVEAAAELARRPSRPDLAADPRLPTDTRLWAALQEASGGIWAGCVYDEVRIAGRLRR